jgi:ABC-type lipoprotein export system ATPase subunit
MNPQAPVIHLDGVSRRFRRGAESVLAVDDVSLDVIPGELIVISGPSGSGKTTLLNLLIGWEQPDAGARTARGPTDRWADLAVVPQQLGLIDHCTVGENVRLPGRVNRLEFDPDHAMERLGIEHLADRFPQETSLGEQQRTAVARAVVTRPRVLVVDEPTSHQDERNAARIVELLAEIAAAGSAIVAATHDERVTAVADHHLLMRDGRLTPSHT